ncbi:hypothetical protein A1OU_21730 [Enterovibrio norvegicus]|nr:hypothetical protein A1OU_21730 [Enterovibrio norvegicus]
MLAHGKDPTLIWVYSKRESGLPLLNNQEACFSKMEIHLVSGIYAKKGKALNLYPASLKNAPFCRFFSFVIFLGDNKLFKTYIYDKSVIVFLEVCFVWKVI